MSESDRVIRQVLDLLETTSHQKRDNVRTILLAQFGCDIIPHCVNKYLEQPPAEYRAQIATELAKMKDLVKRQGIKLEQ